LTRSPALETRPTEPTYGDALMTFPRKSAATATLLTGAIVLGLFVRETVSRHALAD